MLSQQNKPDKGKIHLRINTNTKTEVTKVLKNLKLSTSGVIELFYEQLLCQGVEFINNFASASIDSPTKDGEFFIWIDKDLRKNVIEFLKTNPIDKSKIITIEESDLIRTFFDIIARTGRIPFEIKTKSTGYYEGYTDEMRQILRGYDNNFMIVPVTDKPHLLIASRKSITQPYYEVQHEETISLLHKDFKDKFVEPIEYKEYLRFHIMILGNDVSLTDTEIVYHYDTDEPTREFLIETRSANNKSEPISITDVENIFYLFTHLPAHFSSGIKTKVLHKYDDILQDNPFLNPLADLDVDIFNLFNESDDLLEKAKTNEHILKAQIHDLEKLVLSNQKIIQQLSKDLKASEQKS